MIEEVSANIYRIEIPLPQFALGSMNCYIIHDTDRHLIIDPGYAHFHCFEAMNIALRKLGIDREHTDFFVTHHHPDHFSLVSQFLSRQSMLYINRFEADLVEQTASGSVLTNLVRLFEAIGFPEKDPVKLLPEFAGEAYRRKQWPFCYIQEGDIIESGDYRLRCIVTPGHSLAHTCLYEPDRKILFSGDAISPVLTLYSTRSNPLKDYLKSLHRFSQMNIDLVLPGHHSIFKDCAKKISQLNRHFEKKLEAVLIALADNGKDSYQVATTIWQGTAGRQGWDTVPALQKFFSTRDCFVHLRYLEVEGRVRQDLQGQRIVYFQETRKC
jgi:glyoxylase-like metal-dependent hydrolase (beta-lactamase superfamily II)